MNTTLPDVVVDVALECYGRLERLQPGSEDADTAEHAISLALSAQREVKPKELLLNDVLRNARHSVRRSHARYLQAVDEAGRLAAVGIATGGTGAFATTETPEEICIANELERTLAAEACRCGRHGARVLSGLLDGETSEMIAAATGVSMSTVNRTVRQLRDQVVARGYREAA